MKKNSKHIIIFVPGFKGSTLIDNAKTLIWPNFIKAQVNHKISLSNDLPDIDLKNPMHFESGDIVKSVNVLPGLFTYDIYGKFINTIQQQMQSRAELLLFHYDWRQDLIIHVEKLKTLLEQIARNKKCQIDIICHSMGGLITSRVMQTIKIDAVRHLFFVGVPYQGALKILLDLIHGYRFGFNKTLLSPKAMSSFLSLYYLLPRYPWSTSNDNLFDIETWKKFNLGYLTSQNNFSQIEFLKTQLKKVDDFYRKMESEAHLISKKTKLIFINNITRSTPTQIQFDSKKTIQFNQGDGTVPSVSLQVPEYYKQFDCKTYPIDKPHALSFTDHGIINLILKYL